MNNLLFYDGLTYSDVFIDSFVNFWTLTRRVEGISKATDFYDFLTGKNSEEIIQPENFNYD